MGSAFLAICKECGFVKKFLLGGNMHNFRTFCPIPALDFEEGSKNTILSVNYFSYYDGTRYKFYSSDELKGDNVGNITFSVSPGGTEEEITINAEGNLCPKCNKFSVKFTRMGFTD